MNVIKNNLRFCLCESERSVPRGCGRLSLDTFADHDGWKAECLVRTNRQEPKSESKDQAVRDDCFPKILLKNLDSFMCHIYWFKFGDFLFITGETCSLKSLGYGAKAGKMICH